MFEKILLATDGSETALKAARAAGDLAAKVNGVITLLFVMEPFNEMAYISLPGYELGIDPEKVERFQRESAHAVLERTAEVIKATGAVFSSRYEIGAPPAVIVSVAETESFDVIVIGSRGRGPLASFLLGSVCDRVVHRAHCPVLVIK
ncbi:MAG: universal stress protein [Chloracidobacterium sp.]|uniref:Universal stress protein n=1 Tax=Chloracidobacterium validum TaxID=2821543 RepID=A0ABX8B4M1_9BACT|nr:universal stress protein [Chloracidobacterium validum]QUW01916.1 universal stress protein [Chloracidobacterium validum]